MPLCSVRAVVLAAALILTPPGARAADLVVWWDKGYTPEEDAAVKETVAAFKQQTAKQVELALYPQAELPNKIRQALETGRPPDIAFGTWLSSFVALWAFDDRLVDLSGAIGPFANLFDPDGLDRVRMLDGKTGQKALYGLPIGRVSNHVHVWKILLERAGFGVADIPREWNAFWSFWCDRVQPAVRASAGRDDVWGVGLVMSVDATDTKGQFAQFLAAYDADYVTRDGKLVIDDPEIRHRLVKALDSYTAIYRKGCTPPDFGELGRQRQQSGVPHADRRHDDRTGRSRSSMRSSTTVPRTTTRTPPPSSGRARPAASRFRSRAASSCGGLQGRRPRRHREGVRPLPCGRGLAGALSRLLRRAFSAADVEAARAAVLARPERPAPHGVGDAVQPATAGPRLRRGLGQLAAPWSTRERVWAKAIHRVATEGISPEQAVDEAIARIKQILGE